MAGPRRTTTAAAAVAQPRLLPLDAAEQDQVLRSRLSHTLSHRPLQGLKSKIAALASSSPSAETSGSSSSLPEEFSLQRTSLLSDLQSYLLSLSRTSLITTSTAALQVQEYERQYDEIKAEEASSIQRIEGLKKQLAEVRQRRKEKLEYGRVAESLEAWFKSGGSPGVVNAGTIEIEESLSNLLSHLTSSFLYQPTTSSPTSSDAPKISTSSPHSQTLTLLHARIDEMLNLSRQVREIVGWKPGSSSSSSSTHTGAAAPASSSNSSGGVNNNNNNNNTSNFNPNARPFEPGQSTASASSVLIGGKRSRSKPDDLRIRHGHGHGGGGTSLASASVSSTVELEEGEEPFDATSAPAATATTRTSGKRRRVLQGGGTGNKEEGEADDDDDDVDDDDEDEEGEEENADKNDEGMHTVGMVVDDEDEEGSIAPSGALSTAAVAHGRNPTRSSLSAGRGGGGGGSVRGHGSNFGGVGRGRTRELPRGR